MPVWAIANKAAVFGAGTGLVRATPRPPSDSEGLCFTCLGVFWFIFSLDYLLAYLSLCFSFT